jgi:hypothetical protein
MLLGSMHLVRIIAFGCIWSVNYARGITFETCQLLVLERKSFSFLGEVGFQRKGPIALL